MMAFASLRSEEMRNADRGLSGFPGDVAALVLRQRLQPYPLPVFAVFLCHRFQSAVAQSPIYFDPLSWNADAHET